jgi:hypothetical protein
LAEIATAINGTHMLFWTSEPAQRRAILRDMFGFMRNVSRQSYRIITTLHLPGGCRAMLYQPQPKIAADIARGGARNAAAKGVTKKTARKAAKASPPQGRRAKTAARRR